MSHILVESLILGDIEMKSGVPDAREDIAPGEKGLQKILEISKGIVSN